MREMSNILLGVTGSISAYKAADVVSSLSKLGHEVHVVMTKAGAAFITPLTMQSLSKNRVYVDVLQEEDPSRIVHIDLAKSADLFLVAPATANIIGKLASGIADDMLSSVALAVKDIPKLLAPAMNVRMYENPVVQENLELLEKRGYRVIQPRESLLACGDIGKGALASVETIIQEVNDCLSNK